MRSTTGVDHRSISAAAASNCGRGGSPTPPAIRWSGCRRSASCSPAISPRNACFRSFRGSRRTTPQSTAARWAQILTELASVESGHRGARAWRHRRRRDPQRGARLHGRPGQSRGARNAKPAKAADAIVAALGAKNPRRTSRLVGAGMDRFRDPVLRIAHLASRLSICSSFAVTWMCFDDRPAPCQGDSQSLIQLIDLTPEKRG